MVKGSSHLSKKGLMASVRASHTKVHKPVPLFTLPSTSEFASRSTDVFSSLSSLENKHETWMSVNETVGAFEDPKSVDPISPVREVFKKPLPPPCGYRKKFFKRNTKKWIKYSLKDVPLSSDAANKAIAFQFLRDLRKAKETFRKEDSSDDKIVFNVPVKGKRKSFDKAASTSSCDKFTVESEDGVNKIDKKAIKKLEKTKEQSIKLPHLNDSMGEE